MHNPFIEATDDDSHDVELVLQATCGDRASLERLILRHQARIYNIAVRMVFDPQDAEEVTQGVLIKAVNSRVSHDFTSLNDWVIRRTVVD